MFEMNRFSLLCVVSLMCCANIAFAEEPSVTPYRPTVTNSAALPIPGWIDFETGVARQEGKDGSTQSNLLYLAKFALTPDFGVLVGGDAFISQADANTPRLSGAGDTTLLLKHRFVVSDLAALGLEYGIKAPTAASGLGSGKSDLILNGVYSRNIRGHNLDVNMNVSKLGVAGVNESAYRYGWSGTVFRPVNDKWGVMAELSGAMRQGTQPESQWLLASSYAWSNRLVFDAGLSAGISSNTHRLSLFAGMAMLLGQVR
jgi:hypothetical protein